MIDVIINIIIPISLIIFSIIYYFIERKRYYNMIKTDLRKHEGLHISGDISDVSAECILIMREIYKRNKEAYGQTIAQGILTNMLVKAIVEDATKEDVVWAVSDAQKIEYYD